MSRYLVNIKESVVTLLIGLGITWKHFIHARKGIVTLQYPEEKWPRPDRHIGYDHQDYNLIRSRLTLDIDDCIGCRKCERACPVHCITISTEKVDKSVDLGQTSNDTKKRLLVTQFDIDMSECMYCNLCVYPCPEACIYMTGGPNSKKHPIDYEFSEYDRNKLIYKYATMTEEDIQRLMTMPEQGERPEGVEA